VFLRLRKAVRKRGLRVVSIAPFATRGLAKLAARLIRLHRARRPPPLDGGELSPGGHPGR
jgi:NADH-quinone oxidoreductase subunit G